MVNIGENMRSHRWLRNRIGIETLGRVIALNVAPLASERGIHEQIC